MNVIVDHRKDLYHGEKHYFYTYEGNGGYVPVKGFPDIEDAMIGTDDDYSEAHG